MVTNVNMNQALGAYNAINKMNVSPVDLAAQKPESIGPSFSELVQQATGAGIATMYKSESLSTKALIGKADLNDLVQAVSNAELTVQTMVGIRDRVIAAYQDIIRMPI